MAPKTFQLGSGWQQYAPPGSFTPQGTPLNPATTAAPPLTGAAGGFSINTMPPGLAGSYFDEERAKKIRELVGDEYGGLAVLLDVMRREEGSPQKLKEQLEVLGPYFKDVARENQRLGMEANVFKSLLDAPKEFQRAMAEKYRFFGDQLGTLRENAGPPSYITRQYINL